MNCWVTYFRYFRFSTNSLGRRESVSLLSDVIIQSKTIRLTTDFMSHANSTGRGSVFLKAMSYLFCSNSHSCVFDWRFWVPYLQSTFFADNGIVTQSTFSTDDGIVVRQSMFSSESGIAAWKSTFFAINGIVTWCFSFLRDIWSQIFGVCGIFRYASYMGFSFMFDHSVRGTVCDDPVEVVDSYDSAESFCVCRRGTRKT